MGTVNDLPSTLGGSEGQIIILGKIELLSETAQLNNKSAPIDSQVTQVHERVEQVWAPLWLEEWRDASPISQSIFVAVKNIGGRMPANRARQFKQRERREQVVVIHQGDEISGRHSQCAVGVFRHPQIFWETLQSNPGVILFPAVEQRTSLCRLRTPVH